MRDSAGGIYALGIVFTFIIIVSGFLAFTVNYNKAFRMKNRIITILEKYENDITNEDAKREIRDYAQKIGYSASIDYMNSCNQSGYTIDSNKTGYCYQLVKEEKAQTIGNHSQVKVPEYTTQYVNIKTFVSIDIPILNYIFPHISFFSVTGSTKQITKLAN